MMYSLMKVLAFFLVIGTVTGASDCSEQPRVVRYVPGVDLSHYDKIVNWTLVAQNGIQFAFAKATEGKSYVDPTFMSMWNKFHELNIIPGAYHYYRTDYTAEENFANVKRNIFEKVNFTKEQHFAVDFETNEGKLKPEQISKHLHDFLSMVEQELHIKPIIYTYALFWNESMQEYASKYPFSAYRLWIAHWNVLRPNMGPTWNDFYIWQFTSSGHIKGIDGRVDLNWWKA